MLWGLFVKWHRTAALQFLLEEPQVSHHQSMSVCLLSMILSVWMILETNSEFLLRIFQANIKFVLVMMYSNYI